MDTNEESKWISKVVNLDFEQCINLAKNAEKRGYGNLVLACEKRAEELKSKRNQRSVRKFDRTPMKTHIVAENALKKLIIDYKNELPPTTYSNLAKRCDVEPGRWFGQVTDMIDATCALNNIPSFALIRVLKSNGKVNQDAWKERYSHLREKILIRARNANWTDDDFDKMKDGIAFFISKDFGNKKAWKYVFNTIDIENWANG